MDANWNCVDDPQSRHYNQILDARATPIDWTSAEDMRPPHGFYEWVIDILHNPARTPAAGSCIFLHVWDGPASTTVGCTALEASRLVELLGVVSPSAVFVLLPRDEYDALAPRWQLPR